LDCVARPLPCRCDCHRRESFPLGQSTFAPITVPPQGVTAALSVSGAIREKASTLIVPVGNRPQVLRPIYRFLDLRALFLRSPNRNGLQLLGPTAGRFLPRGSVVRISLDVPLPADRVERFFRDISIRRSRRGDQLELIHLARVVDFVRSETIRGGRRVWLKSWRFVAVRYAERETCLEGDSISP
jgi:hypothetical protein